jgi:hypothetical protein
LVVGLVKGSFLPSAKRGAWTSHGASSTENWRETFSWQRLHADLAGAHTDAGLRVNHCVASRGVQSVVGLLAVLGLDRHAALDEGGSGNPLRDGCKAVQDSREGGVYMGVWCLAHLSLRLEAMSELNTMFKQKSNKVFKFFVWAKKNPPERVCVSAVFLVLSKRRARVGKLVGHF